MLILYHTTTEITNIPVIIVFKHFVKLEYLHTYLLCCVLSPWRWHWIHFSSPRDIKYRNQLIMNTLEYLQNITNDIKMSVSTLNTSDSRKLYTTNIKQGHHERNFRGSHEDNTQFKQFFSPWDLVYRNQLIIDALKYF